MGHAPHPSHIPPISEPTSGLDSFQAQSVMETLRKLARAGRTVVASVHQPRSSIYAMLDRVMLLSGGRTVYFGTAGDAAAAHFAAAGYPVPIGFNPADHFMDVICVDRRDPTAEEASSARVESLVATWRDTKFLTMAAPAGTGDVAKSSLAELEAREVQGVVGSLNRSCVALRLLTRRTLRELTRDKAALIFQYSMNLFFAVMVTGHLHLHLHLRLRLRLTAHPSLSSSGSCTCGWGRRRCRSRTARGSSSSWR